MVVRSGENKGSGYQTGLVSSLGQERVGIEWKLSSQEMPLLLADSPGVGPKESHSPHLPQSQYKCDDEGKRRGAGCLEVEGLPIPSFLPALGLCWVVRRCHWSYAVALSAWAWGPHWLRVTAPSPDSHQRPYGILAHALKQAMCRGS